MENLSMEALDQTRFERGLDMLNRIHGARGLAVIEALDEIAPDFGRSMVEFTFGDVYQRSGLDISQRELAAVAALAAVGAVPQLKVHLHAALNVGCDRRQLLEILVQTAIYAGVPAAINSLFAAKEIFTERGNGEAARLATSSTAT